jgi:7-cyano-7-deazaguanine synthase
MTLTRLGVGDGIIDNLALLLFSGGLDSAAALHLLLGQSFEVHTLFVNYGQQAAQQERAHAKMLALDNGVGFASVDIRGGRAFGPGEITGRNALIISAAITFGGIDQGLVALGLHSGTRYYDSSPDFVERMDALVSAQTDGRLKLFIPFLSWTKRDIWDYCLLNEVAVGSTYSCEAGTTEPCGACPSCKDRRQLDACRT